jgi:hypothetical protein
MIFNNIFLIKIELLKNFYYLKIIDKYYKLNSSECKINNFLFLNYLNKNLKKFERVGWKF